MTAVQALIGQDMSLNRSLKYCGMFKRQWYWKPKARKPKANAGIVEAIRTIRGERQFYGAKRIAAEASRRLGMPVNRKLVQRVYKRLGWGTPAEPKEPKSRWKPIIAVRPNQVWETDITYVWCGAVDGWCYCFNVLDIFTRQWLSYRFDTLATNDVAIESIVEAVSAARPECANLTLQCDNGSQYTSRNFRKAVSLLGIHLKFIWNHTPQQNGHIESFHNTLKREYIWPHDFANYQEAEAVIAEAFRDYNQDRLHSALRYVPPKEFLTSWEETHK